MHPQKLENLISLNHTERYDYFIRETVKFQEIWTIATPDGYIIFKDNQGDEIFPVWPHKELADKCAFQEHKEMGVVAEKIALKSFLDNCIPDMIEDKVLFGVFYNDKRSGLAVPGEKLLEDLNREYEEIYG